MSGVLRMEAFAVEFQTEEEAEEIERLPSDAILYASLLRRGIVCELQRELQKCDGFFCRISVIYDGTVLL